MDYADSVYHVLKKSSNGKDILFWLGAVQAEDEASAVALVAHDLKRHGDTTVPQGRDVELLVIDEGSMVKVEAGWYAEPPELVVGEVVE